jgi:hypothetical protein
LCQPAPFFSSVCLFPSCLCYWCIAELAPLSSLRSDDWHSQPLQIASSPETRGKICEGRVTDESDGAVCAEGAWG